jgi:hypothetical protein
MAKLWTAQVQPNGQDTPAWLLNSPHGDDGTIYQVLRSNAKECMITTSISSILGSLLMIMLINKFDRRVALIWSFVALSAALVVLGVAFLYLFHTPSHIVLIVLYALIQFGFAFGPNTLTFSKSSLILLSCWRSHSHLLPSPTCRDLPNTLPMHSVRNSSSIRQNRFCPRTSSLLLLRQRRHEGPGL